MSIAIADRVIAIVLGGGRGTRLHPLTLHRSKPAVPLAGKYRLIDVPLSNCIHSGIRRMYVLTQFNSASLNRHIALTYKFDSFREGFVEVLAADQTPDTEKWFQGTADAVRRSLVHIADTPGQHVLILSGDALHRQDFAELLAQHERDGADVTVTCKLVSGDDAQGFGVVGIDGARRVTRFREKPPADELPELAIDRDVVRRAGLRPSADRPYLASMGIYLFRREVLLDVLRDESAEDFGKQIIPRAIAGRRVFAQLFDGYWEDIGTIGAFFRANLDLLQDNPPFQFYRSGSPIFTHHRLLPTSEVIECHIRRALLAEGCRLRRATLENCVVGVRSMVDEGASLHNVVMMGADGYEGEIPCASPDAPPLGVGPGAVVRNAILDKNARIGAGARIVNEAGVQHADAATHSIREGIVIVPKGAVVPPGTVI